MAVLTAPTKAIIGIDRSNPISRGIHFCYSFDNRLGKDINGKFDVIKYGGSQFKTGGINFNESNGCFTSKDFGAGKVWSVIDQFSTGKPGMTFLNVFSIDQYPAAFNSYLLSQGAYASNTDQGHSGGMSIYAEGSTSVYIRTSLWDSDTGMKFNTRGNMPTKLALNKIYIAIGTIKDGSVQTYLFSAGDIIRQGTAGTYITLNSVFGAKLINVGGHYNPSNQTINSRLLGTIYLSATFVRTLSLAEIYSLIRNPYQILKTI